MNFRFLLLLLLACTLGGCGEKPPAPEVVAAEFFQKIAAGQTVEAYASTADHFQLRRSRQSFGARVKELHLDKATPEWSAPEPSGETMRVQGVLNRPKAGPLKVIVTLKKAGGQWKVFEVRHEREGVKRGWEDLFEVFRTEDLSEEKGRVISEPSSVAMPTPNQLRELVDKVMTDFNTGIQEKDFKAFFDSTAERWRYRGKSPAVLTYIGNDPKKIEASDPDNKDQRLTLQTIRTEFQPFVDQKVDLTALLGKKIIFDAEPYISSEAVLYMEGHYEDYYFGGAKSGTVAAPLILSFRMEFYYETSGWKLFGFHPTLHAPHPTNK